MIGGGAFTILGPGGPWLLDHIADGQKVWRLGRLRVDGVEGMSLGDLRARHITLADEHGVWAEADDVSLKWRPFDILFGAVRIADARAARIHIIRRPELEAPQPGGGGGLDVFLDSLSIARVELDQAVVDTAAVFKLDGDLKLQDDALHALDLRVVRLDSDLDRANVHVKLEDKIFELSGDVEGRPGGVLAHALGVPEAHVTAQARGRGDLDIGGALATASVGDAPALEARLDWTREAWTANADARLAAMPALRDIVARIGERAALAAHGARSGPYEARVSAPNAVLTLSGAQPPAWPIAQQTDFTLDSPRLAQLVPELNIGGAAARASGKLIPDGSALRVEGTLTANDLDIVGQSIDLSGPVRVRIDDRLIRADGDLGIGPDALDVFDGATLTAALTYDRQRERTELSRARLDGPSVFATAQGFFIHNDGEFSGEWRVKRLQPVSPQLEGRIDGRWRARTDPAQGWLVSFSGAGQGVRGAPEFVPDLAGPNPRLDAALSIKDGVTTVQHARIDGERLRAGVTGFIRGSTANLAIEASARGPVRFGAATADGAVDATGRITGDLARPRIDARAVLASLDVSGVIIEQPQIDILLRGSSLQDYRGTVSLQGVFSGQAAHGQSDIAIDRAGVTLPNLTGDLAALHAQGSARFTDAGPTADLQLSGAIDNLAPGASGQVQGHAALTTDRITIDASLANARIGDLRVRTAQISAMGPYDNIAAHFTLRGALNRAALRLDGTGALTSVRGGTDLRIEGQGSLADAPFSLRTPILARWRGRAFDLGVDAQFGEGALRVSWRDDGRALSGEAIADHAPIAPIAAIWGERGEGAMSGRARIASDHGGLTGSLNADLEHARFSSRADENVTGHLQADLSRDRLRGQIDVQSSSGMTARFTADAPVETDTAPLRIALTPHRMGEASWSVHGPIDGLWAAARLNDQVLDGQLDGEGSLRFGAGALTGTGAIAIANGRFEDKISGVKLQDVNARVRFGDDGAQIETFSARDARGGQITATGGAANPSEGRIAIHVQDMRLVDRPDARATSSGDLALEWHGLTSRVSGDLTISEGQVNIATAPTAAVPQLDVIEINQPVTEDEPILPLETSVRGQAVTLDIRVRAPGRVFTRGRGLDAEWELDMHVMGDLATPRIVGTARTVRGDLSLSGRQFEITSGLITFNGDPNEAILNIVAEREATDLTARITLTGTANNPEVSLSSTPSLPEEEILPQVLFGRSVADLSALEAAQLASSLAALSGQGSFDIAEAARSLSGLDRLDVRQDESGGLLVSGGIYLTRDVYVEVGRTGLGQAQTRVEWRLRPHLLLVTSFLANGDRRASIRWRRERD